LKKESFCWNKIETKYFEKLKEDICATPILATPNLTKTFIMECDASRKDIGVVLMQEGGHHSFQSSNLKERTYSNPSMKRKC